MSENEASLVTQSASPKPLSWREKRWQRRRQRQNMEELVGWILVPLILVGAAWILSQIINATGTTPTALYDNVQILVNGGKK